MRTLALALVTLTTFATAAHAAGPATKAERTAHNLQVSGIWQARPKGFDKLMNSVGVKVDYSGTSPAEIRSIARKQTGWTKVKLNRLAGMLATNLKQSLYDSSPAAENDFRSRSQAKWTDFDFASPKPGK